MNSNEEIFKQKLGYPKQTEKTRPLATRRPMVMAPLAVLFTVSWGVPSSGDCPDGGATGDSNPTSDVINNAVFG